MTMLRDQKSPDTIFDTLVQVAFAERPHSQEALFVAAYDGLNQVGPAAETGAKTLATFSRELGHEAWRDFENPKLFPNLIREVLPSLSQEETGFEKAGRTAAADAGLISGKVLGQILSNIR